MTATFDATGDTPRIGQPRQFFHALQNQVRKGYAVHPDGRLLFNKYEQRDTATLDSAHVVLVLGWTAELARRLASTR
ncbi:MAG: hypothetical protein HQ485_02765 [Acidobacteria bacterium]|nr:hypothetical protein [Acidobacteriota bacterium]